jgi:phenylalanyl-tRNA synthetase beta chain
MKVPLGWLREFVDVKASPRELADALTLSGLAVDGILEVGGETVLDLDVTTNRVDAMNVYGVAREVAVLYGLPLKPPETTVSEAGKPAKEALSVEILAPELCPRFCARVLDVRIGPSPVWIRERLELVGVRPISNVVDLTNYVLFELGQPSHAFDLARVKGGRLSVRWGREREALKTLDGADRVLNPRVGVVAGLEGALGLAGIMGGAASEVSDGTTEIALEAAHWNALAVRRAAKSFGMHTEASHRFERGSDPELPPLALARLAHLLEKIGAGTCRPGLVDVGAAPARRKVRLRGARIDAVLGAAVPPQKVRGILEGLGFSPEGDSYSVPGFRGDVAREEDLIEEVARHFGLDKIPSSLPPTRQTGTTSPLLRAEQDLRALLVGFGLSEVVTLSFVSEGDGRLAGESPVVLENPLSEEQAALRNSIVLPGLLSVLRTNLRQGRRDLGIFEVGRVYQAKGEGPWPTEVRRLGVLLTGALPSHWSQKGRPFDLFDLKGFLEAIPMRLEVRSFESSSAALPSFLQPGRGALLVRGGATLGYLGALQPEMAGRFEARGDVLVAEISIEGLFEGRPPAVRVEPLPRFPIVQRDISAIVPLTLPSLRVVEAALRGAGPLARDARITSRFDGPPAVPAGHVSLTVTLRLEHRERTLTNDEVQAAVQSAVQSLKGLGAEIRGE